jgi:cyclopropane fatty-acyl-phospholipid synthase-like methyltransferase
MQEKDAAEQKKVASYYDEFWKSFPTKPNTRQRTIYKYLLKAGLKNNSTVLEVGCGNGVITKMIADKVSAGSVTGVDISSETIAMLRQKFTARKNMRFMVSDMSSWNGNEKFDFILLPDVIEHIPIEQHNNLFKVLRNIAHDNTVLVINIPEPFMLEWAHKHQKELLQIIDQPIHTNLLLNNIYAHGFYIEFLKSYSLSINPFDYQIMIFKIRKENREFKIKTKTELMIEEIKARIYFWR